MTPLLFTQPFESRQTNVIFISPAMFVGQMRQLQRFEHAIHNQGRTESRAETKKEHSTAAITAQRLHRRIVDDFHLTMQRPLEVKADPPRSKIVRLAHWPAMHDRPRIANRNHVILPAGCCTANRFDHFLRGHFRAG